MRNRFILLMSICFFWSCSNEVEIHADGDPIPVVYGLLNPNAPLQNIRVGRSFQSNQNDIQQQPKTDSTIWINPPVVYMEEWKDGLPDQTISFEPIEGTVKDSGYFPSDNLQLYQAIYQPKFNTKYHLYVYFPDNDHLASAWAVTPAQTEVEDPKQVPGRKITFLPNHGYNIRWRPGKEGGLYQGIFTIYIREESAAGWENRSISIMTSLYVEMNPQDLVMESFNGRRFYDALVQQLETNPMLTRSVYSVDFQFITGGKELAFYAQSQSGGTESFLRQAEYSNINNGIGIFSSLMYTVVPNLELSNVTKDSLAYHELTRHLGFVDHRGKIVVKPQTSHQDEKK